MISDGTVSQTSGNGNLSILSGVKRLRVNCSLCAAAWTCTTVPGHRREVRVVEYGVARVALAPFVAVKRVVGPDKGHGCGPHLYLLQNRPS
jgi:hypothetical protein